MQRITNIRDLAKRIGLSTCTVSKVLSDSAHKLKITDAVRQRVEEAARKYGYVPNINAQRLFRKRSHVIGCLVPSTEELSERQLIGPTMQDMSALPPRETPKSVFSNIHFGGIMGGIEEKLHGTDYNLLVMFNWRDGGMTRNLKAMFDSKTLDGLLIWGAHRSDREWKDLVGLPHIFISNQPDNITPEKVNFIGADYRHSMSTIIGKLRAAGGTRFGFLVGKEHTSVCSELINGISDAGLAPTQDNVFYSDYTLETGQFIGKKLLETASFDTIVAASQTLALGIYKEYQAAGREILLGAVANSRLDDRNPYPFLCGYTQDKTIGCKAVELLLDMIENGCSRNVQLHVPMEFSDENP